MFELWGDKLFMRRFMRGRNLDFKSTRGRGPVDKGKPYGRVIYAKKHRGSTDILTRDYTNPQGNLREKYLHATKGWRDERVSN